MKEEFGLLSRLWLHEPDDDTIRRAHEELHLPLATPIDLAAAYTDLFLLNVYPYGTVFTDPGGGLNAADARHMAALYEAHDYHPAALTQVAAPDHVGLCLGFLAHLSENESVNSRFLSSLLEWIPICCLAVEREPTSHPFYRALAALTRDALLTENVQIRNLNSTFRNPDSEFTLHDLVRFFLIPARCGMFLSRAMLGKLANTIDLRLPFGPRFDVALSLFEAAGESGRVSELLRVLNAQIEEWAVTYRKWAAEYPVWLPFAGRWLDRLDNARATLTQMREAVENPPEVELYEAADFHGVS